MTLLNLKTLIEVFWIINFNTAEFENYYFVLIKRIVLDIDIVVVYVSWKIDFVWCPILTGDI